MAQASHRLFHRIRCVKSSLDKAEQSFMDNKDIRGELDLMLAEAELKNLRRKKELPWSWSRQLLAGCVAALLALAGFGGYYVARGQKAQQPTPTTQATAATMATAAAEQQQATAAAKPVNEATAAQAATNAADRVTISKADMHRLVQSAKNELSSSK